MAPLTADSSVTSVAMKVARAPSAAAAAVPCASFTSRSVTFPPANTMRLATASPSPDAPPVTTACDSFSCMGGFSGVFQNCWGRGGGGPLIAEKHVDHGVRHVFDPVRRPARSLVLVDDERAHAFEEVALLEALLSHREFHAKTGGEALLFAESQFTQRNAQHGGRAGAHERGGSLRPIGIFGAGFGFERRQDGRHRGMREMRVDAGSQQAQSRRRQDLWRMGVAESAAVR